jgi:hypothetical protein
MSSRIADNIIAYKILTMLVTPFEETSAFKLGIIDKKGNKIKDVNSDAEKDSYDYLDKLVFNMKKIINKLPGGDAKLKNIIAALYLLKEHNKYHDEIINEKLLLKIINNNIVLAEETIFVNSLLEDGVIGTAPTNVSMPADGSPSKVSTDVPVKRKKTSVIRRQNLNLVAVDLNQKAL